MSWNKPLARVVDRATTPLEARQGKELVMTKTTGILVGVVAVVVVAFGIYMVDFDMTDEGALPDVDVSVEGGEMPEVEAETGSITAGTETEEVTVPDVDVEVDTDQAEVEVPTVDVNPPEDDS